MVVSRRAWETYPQNYRAREMAILADWIRAGESGSVVGLAGVGVEAVTFLDEAVQPVLQVPAGRGIGVLLDGKTRRGVLNEDRTQTFLNTGFLNRRFDQPGNLVEALA